MTQHTPADLCIVVTGLPDGADRCVEDHDRAVDAATAVFAGTSQAEAEAMIRAYDHEGEDTDTPALAALRDRWMALVADASGSAHHAATKGWAHPERFFVLAEVSL